MKNIKKIFPVFLILLLMITACTKDPKASSTNKASQAPTNKVSNLPAASSPKVSSSASSASNSTASATGVATATAAATTSQTTVATFKELKASDDSNALAGSIFIGSWSTAIEVKDVTITKDGKTFIVDDFKDNAKTSAIWTSAVGAGSWSSGDGVCKQSDAAIADARFVLNDFNADKYTLELKAKKVSGNEGFLVGFGVKDDGNYCRVNLGGWTNTKSAIQKVVNNVKDFREERTDVTINSDEWYSIKIVVGTDVAECYLNNELILTASDLNS